MKSFSEREGFRPVAEVIQTEWVNDDLRNSLWNALHLSLWSRDGFLYRSYGGDADIFGFSASLWFLYFKKPIDSRPDRSGRILGEIRDYFFACAWYEVYDFLEFVVSGYPDIENFINEVLGRELSGYRFISGQIADITGEQEIEMLDEALRDSRFTGVSTHLGRALELYTDRQNPDYRNSIKESISAVESMARLVSGKSKATLGDALKVIEGKGALHPALKEGFLKLYGYTSSEQGIRHAMLDEPNLSQADARYFLLSCTSFVNYLKAQMP